MTSLADISFVGMGLVRPECVLTTERGDVFASDWRGGVSHIEPDGSQHLYEGKTADLPEGLRPNAIALESDGSFVFANLGTETGGAWRIDRRGQVRPILAELEGKPILPSNFVTRDEKGRLWLTVSTRVQPRSDDFAAISGTGHIIMMDTRGARIVADGLGYANECRAHPSGDSLYVIETCGRRLTRLPILKSGDLGPQETVAEFGKEGFPNGFGFDVQGGCWVACIVSNQLVHVSREGRVEVVLEDKDVRFVAATERAFQGTPRTRPPLDDNPAQTLRNISSVAFGGTDLRSLYLGCVSGGSIAKLPAPVAGHPPVHWRYPTPG